MPSAYCKRSSVRIRSTWSANRLLDDVRGAGPDPSLEANLTPINVFIMRMPGTVDGRLEPLSVRIDLIDVIPREAAFHSLDLEDSLYRSLVIQERGVLDALVADRQ